MKNDKIILNNSEHFQISDDLKTFKNHTSIQKEDAKKLKDYFYKLERLIADDNYLELEYAAECFTCAVREIAAKTITVSKTKSLMPCTGSNIYQMTSQIEHHSALKTVKPLPFL